MTSWRRGGLDSLTLGQQRTAMATGDGEAVGWLQASTPASSGAPPVKMKAPKGATVFGDPSGTVEILATV
jgi:hypothetical protein